MKHFSENQLLNFAVHMAAVRRLGSDSVKDLDPHRFFTAIDSPDFRLSAYLDRNLRAEQLARIGTLAITGPGKSDLRQTTVQDVLGSGAVVSIEWDGRDAKQKIVMMAAPVVAAAMYDVLATKRVVERELRQGERCGHDAERTPYLPLPEMRKFVFKREVYRTFAYAA